MTRAATMHQADLSDLKCDRCGHTPEAECYYVGEGCYEINGPDRDRIDGYYKCEECGWPVADLWCCAECGCDLDADAEWVDKPLCVICAAEAGNATTSERETPRPSAQQEV